MSKLERSFRIVAPLAAALFLAAACSVTDSTAPMRDGRIAAPIADMVPFEPTPEEVEVCKLYEPGVNGPTVTFDWAIDDSANGSINATGSVNVAPGECVVLPPAGTRTHEHLVYVQERVPVGFYSTYIAKEYHMGVVTVGNTVVADTATAYMHGDRGWALIFTNNVARGTLGCSHGYWKVEQHWDSWPAPYGPTTLFSVAFENAFPGKTMGEVLALQGGGLNALGREAVAALLNASSGFFYYAPAEVQAMFDAAYPGTKDEYNALKWMFEMRNIAGCPLD